MTATDLYYDPYDYAIDADPYPIWRRLRDEAPVYRNEQHGFYALSRYDDVLTGLLDHETYRSGHGIVLEMITDEPYQDIPMMIMKDPPEHTRLRKLVSRAFTPRRIAELERNVATICATSFLDTVEGQDEFDYIEAFAGLLPPTVILALVGFPGGLRGGVPRTGSTRACTSRTVARCCPNVDPRARWSRRTARSTTRPSPSCPS